MKSELFVKLLRKVIREEVQSVVRKELRSVLTERKTDHSKAITHGIDLSNMVSNTPSKPSKKYVKDNILNDILNETSGFNGGGNTQENYPSMASFKSEMAESFRQPNIPPVTDIQGKPADTSNKNVATVVNAMTKDYSQLMKAIDKRKGKR
jgi:hypothetical protein